MSYNPADGLVYGLAIKVDPDGASWQRSIVALDPTTSKVATVGIVPDYKMELVRCTSLPCSQPPSATTLNDGFHQAATMYGALPSLATNLP